jgi:hypothetical protein
VRCLDESGREVAVYLPLSDYVKFPPYAAISHPQVMHAVFDDPFAVPAVVIDDVVYQRARWELDAAALSVAQPQARFLEMRRFARSSGAGRFVFCRTNRERKPYLIDLASVLSADLVGHVVKDSSRVSAEEMRPGPDQLWLRDDQGCRYTSELRMQLVGREVA